MTVKLHFFGKNCLIDRDLYNREKVLQSLNSEGFKQQHLLFVNQIHSAEVVVIDNLEKIHGDRNLPKADALVTNLPHVAIAVITADCAPILLQDEQKKVIAAVHAGWRGAKMGVIKSAIAAMKKLGAKNIVATIGPMIQQKSYEVSQEFFDEFLVENADNKKFFLPGKEAGKHWFNLPLYVERKLQEEKVDSIQNLAIDTYKDEKNFFSFRRSTHRGEKDCGRNVSVIMVS